MANEQKTLIPEPLGPYASAIQLLQDTAVEAAGAAGKVQILKIPQEPDFIYGVAKSDGSFSTCIAAPRPRGHVLQTLDEVIHYVEEKGSEETVIWYDRERITIVLDDNNRRDFATLQLRLTPQIQLLQKLEVDRPEMDQRTIRRLLRVDLGRCRRDDILLNWVSKVQFGSSGQTRGDLSRSRESIGRDIEADAISEAGECPDEVAFDVRIFDDPGMCSTQGVRCAFEVRPTEQRFLLMPFPLECHNAIELEVNFIGEKLQKTCDAPAFRGRFQS